MSVVTTSESAGPPVATAGSDRVLDPMARTSEVLFGLIMALTFTGTLGAATAGREEVRTLLIGMIGCNIAWGLVDAMMFLMGVLTERGREMRLHSPDRPVSLSLTRRDVLGAIAVFLLVVLATFPVVIPFIVFSRVHVALRVSNAIAIVMLFCLGYWLGDHAGYRPWRTGASMVVLGLVLVAIAIALGG